MDLPTTLAGWAGLILAILGSLSIILGIVIKLAKSYIDSQINKTLASTIRKAVIDGLVPVTVSMGHIQLQLITQDGELARVRRIEEQINNGLITRQARIEKKVDRIIEHLVWDGNDRREDDGGD